MKKVLVFLADGFEEIEALSVADVLRRASLKCDLCSIKDEFVRGTHNIIIQSDCIIDNIDQDEYDAIVLPGGLPGADNLLDKRVKDIAIKFNDEGITVMNDSWFGLMYVKQLFQNNDFWRALRNTFVNSMYGLVFGILYYLRILFANVRHKCYVTSSLDCYS